MPKIQHMVLVKFKPDVPGQKIDQFVADLRQFWSIVPGIIYFSGGPYSSPEGLSQGFTHGFLVTFESSAARDSYLKHPQHEQLVARILPTLDGVVAFDFEEA